MKTILLIGLGSFIGGMVHYLISCCLSNSIVKGFLVNTLTFTLAGCLFLGILSWRTSVPATSQQTRNSLFLAVASATVSCLHLHE